MFQLPHTLRPATASARHTRSGRPLAHRRITGLSVIELLAVAVVLCLVLTGALPSLREARARQLLRAVAAELETDVHLARGMALSTDRGVRLSIQALPTGGSCTVVHTGAANACRCTGGGQAQCSGGASLIKLSEQPASQGVTHTVLNRSMLFDPGKGTVTPTATLTITDTRGNSVRKIINIMGRVRSCSPSGLSGLPACA